MIITRWGAHYVFRYMHFRVNPLTHAHKCTLDAGEFDFTHTHTHTEPKNAVSVCAVTSTMTTIWQLPCALHLGRNLETPVHAQLHNTTPWLHQQQQQSLPTPPALRPPSSGNESSTCDRLTVKSSRATCNWSPTNWMSIWPKTVYWL